MPELPEKKTETTSTAKESMFTPNIPVVHSLSGIVLEKLGFIKFDINRKGNTVVTTYKNGENIVTYDGVQFVFNGKPVQFVEDLNDKK
jgi:hypothetical protein